MVMETERLIIREYSMDDFDALYEILSDAETMKYYPKPYDEDGVWIRACRRHPGTGGHTAPPARDRGRVWLGFAWWTSIKGKNDGGDARMGYTPPK